MVSDKDIAEVADAVVEAAVTAHVNEIMQSGLPEKANEPTQPGSIDRYRQEFGWIRGRFTAFTGISTGGTAAIESFFNGLIHAEFGVERESESPTGDGKVDADEYLPGKAQFEEYHQLSNIIYDAKGEVFQSFSKNFLNKLEGIWGNQILMAKCLATTAGLAEDIYEAMRNDLVRIGNDAIVAYNMITAKHTGSEDGFLSGAGVALDIIGLGVGILGLFASGGTALALGAGGLLIGIAEMGQEDAVGYLRRSDSISGGTVDAVNASLSNKLNEFTGELRTTEGNYIELLSIVNEAFQDPSQLELVLAPNMSFPK